MAPKRLLAWIPNSFTAGNLLCGFAATAWALSLALKPEPQPLERFTPCVWLIGLATLCDAVDGYLARLTGTAGPFGVKLDSFADSVTFGLAPAMLMACTFLGHRSWPMKMGWVACALYYFCAVVRLARYNVIASDTKFGFVGLPSPGAALLVVACFMAFRDAPGTVADVTALACTAGGGLLMVSALPFCGIKGLKPAEKRGAVLVLAAFAFAIPWVGPWAAVFAFLAAYCALLGWGWALLRGRVLGLDKRGS